MGIFNIWWIKLNNYDATTTTITKFYNDECLFFSKNSTINGRLSTMVQQKQHEQHEQHEPHTQQQSEKHK